MRGRIWNRIRENDMIGFIIGSILGVGIGITTMCLMFVAKEADDRDEKIWKNKENKEDKDT